MGNRQVKGGVIQHLAQQGILLLPARIVQPQVGPGQQAHGRRRRHQAGHADAVHVGRGDAGIGEQGRQRPLRKTALVFPARVPFLIGSEQHLLAVAEGHAGVEQVFIDTEPKGHDVSWGYGVMTRRTRRTPLP